MSLSQLQQDFAYQIAQLIAYIHSQLGWTCTLGESWRSDVQAELNALDHDEREHVAVAILGIAPGLSHAVAVSTGVGIRASVHRMRLAQDLNLFRDGVFQTSPDAYRQFGEWWKKQHPAACWGGDFGDYDHFSFTFGGVK